MHASDWLPTIAFGIAGVNSGAFPHLSRSVHGELACLGNVLQRDTPFCIASTRLRGHTSAWLGERVHDCRDRFRG